jgi:glycosyltransferase involved in cell wall biosynthesis
MKILLYTDSDVFAGTERHMLDLACALRRIAAGQPDDGGSAPANPVEAAIACPSPGALAERAAAAGVPVVSIPKSGQVDRNAIRVLSQMAARGQVDVIHAHNGRTHVAAAFAVARARRGRSDHRPATICVATQHFLMPTRTGRTGIKALVANYLHRKASASTAHTIAISDAVRHAAIQRGDCLPAAITTIHNGISPPDLAGAADAAAVRASLGLATDQPFLFCAARLQEEKDIPSLLQAMKHIAAAHPEARCFVAGDGDMRPALDAQLRSLGIAATVTLLGFRRDVPALLRACDLFVLPSLAEPFGLVLVEAMAMSRPVIATDAGGPREIVEHGQTGLLVRPSDPESLAQAIDRLLSSPSERLAFGRAGFARYQAKFTADRMAAQMLQLYRRCLGSAARPARQAVGV